MTIIDEIRAREQRASEEIARLTTGNPGTNWRWSIPANPDRDSDLILADSIADIPRLLAALDAVTKLHYQREDTEDVIPWSCMDGPCEHDDDCPEVAVKGCDECSTPEYIVQWPCPTARAVTAAMEGGTA